MDLALPVLQLIAYVALTLASVIVSVVSAIFSFRNNFGWKPLVLIISHGFQVTSGSDLVSITFSFEIWNRRKYPIVIRYMAIQFNTVNLEDTILDRPWQLTGKTAYDMNHHTVAPSIYEPRSIVVPIKKETILDEIDDTATLKVTYFDPRRRRNKTVQLRHQFRYSGTLFHKP